MKIGVFGCSFACPYSNLGMPTFNVKGKTWMKILKEDFNYDITTHGVSGSSIYYSYLMFKENYQRYDKVVFLGTYPDRKYCPNLEMSHITFAHTLKESVHVKQQDVRLDALIKTYFTYFHNIKEADDMKELMVENIKKIGGNNTLYIDTPDTLGEVSMMEEMTRINKQNAPDYRWCHISNQNNYIFASQIHNWLSEKTFNFDINTFIKPSIEELKSYYELT